MSTNQSTKPWLQRVPAGPNAGSSVDGTVWKLQFDKSMKQRHLELVAWLRAHGHIFTDPKP